MMTRYEAWLNKKSLSAIDPAIYILDISYNAPIFVMTASDRPGRNGQMVTDRHAQSTSVTITFEIHDQDIVRRQTICSRVQAWAIQGGYLTTNDKRGQRLCVDCDGIPAIDSALKWRNALRVTFTAYEQPFWEDENPRSTTIAGTNVSKTLYVPGFGAMTRVEVKARNTSGETMNALTLKAGGTTFDFEGLELEAGQTLEIGYDKHGLLAISANGVSKMHCRTEESDDELMIETRKTSMMSIYAGGSISAVFEARGLYL